MGNVLGEGQFGQCVVGEYEGKAVAVKIAKKSLGMDNFKDFLQEVKLMSFIGKHENIIDFIGAVVDDISKGSVFSRKLYRFTFEQYFFNIFYPLGFVISQAVAKPF